jgi:hypothetical protein
MENNVLSWNVALEKGYEPHLFPYTAEEIPLGQYDTFLEFKIWSKKAMGMSCYFKKKIPAQSFS